MAELRALRHQRQLHSLITKVPRTLYTVTDETFHTYEDGEGRFDETEDVFYFSTQEKANVFLEYMVHKHPAKDLVTYNWDGYASVR